MTKCVLWCDREHDIIIIMKKYFSIIVSVLLLSACSSEETLLEKCADKKWLTGLSKGWSIELKRQTLDQKLGGGSYQSDFAECEKEYRESPILFKKKYK